MIKLSIDETIEDLGRGSLRLIQPQNGFRFGADSVLLAHFAKENYVGPSNFKFLDLFAGSGIVGMLFLALFDFSKSIEGYAVEYQSTYLDILEKNIVLNPRLQLHCLQGNIGEDYHSWSFNQAEEANCNRTVSLDTPTMPFRNLADLKFKVILLNPPYGKIYSGPRLKEASEEIARFEILGDLDAYFQNISKLLVNNGQVFICYRPERLDELLTIASKYNLVGRNLRFVQAHPLSKPKLVLVKLVKNQKSGNLVFQAPIYTSASQDVMKGLDFMSTYNSYYQSGQSKPLTISQLYEGLENES